MTGAGAIGPGEAGIEGVWSGRGGLRMCDRDRGGTGRGLGVWRQSHPRSGLERPSTHPELASPQPTLRPGPWHPRDPGEQPEQEGVCFLFVGDACKSSGQRNNRTKKKRKTKENSRKTTKSNQHQR